MIGGVAEGAASGAAVGGPYGALIGAGASILSSAVARPPTSSTAMSGLGPVNSWFDGSGWTVATGGAKAEGGDRADAVGGISPLMIAGIVVGILVWKLTSKKS